jgi:hypothetical protein
MMLQRSIVLAMAATLLTGCAAGPALFGQSIGAVSGKVSLRSCGGANREGQPACRVAAAAGAHLTFKAASGGAADAKTDAQGGYRVELKPGSYTVTVTLSSSKAPLPAGFADNLPYRGYAGPKVVTVVAGKTVTADFTYTIQLL